MNRDCVNSYTKSSRNFHDCTAIGKERSGGAAMLPLFFLISEIITLHSFTYAINVNVNCWLICPSKYYDGAMDQHNFCININMAVI